MAATNWKDPDRAAQLAKLWNEGHSSTTIARMMGGGLTRNAVIGAVRRANLPFRCSGDYTKPKSQGARKYRKRVKLAKPKPVAPTAAQIIAAIKADGLPIPTPAETDIPRVSFADLENHHCRFPCWDNEAPLPDVPSFCGAKKVPGTPYCAAHLVRCAGSPSGSRRPFVPMSLGRKSQEVINAV